MHTSSPLNHLANTAGLAIGWVDAFGEAQLVSEDTLRNILEALGLPCRTLEQCADSQRMLDDEKNQVVLPPLITGLVGEPILFSSGLAFHGLRYVIQLENGETLEGRFSPDTSEALQTVPLTQVGYHVLQVTGHRVTLAIAPGKCFGIHDLAIAGTRKLWGASAQLYALRDEGDGGLGTYAALAKLARQAGLQGASALAISPVHAMFSADTGRYSPYGPSSRMHLNAMHIDPQTIGGKQAYREAMQAIENSQGLGSALEQSALIDWPASSGLRLRLLRELFNQFKRNNTGQRLIFEQYRNEGGPALQQHAVYEALHAQMRSQACSDDWRQWPAEFRHPENAGVQNFIAEHHDEVEFHTFLQWQATLGLQGAQQAARDSGMAIGLISDMAVGADPKGSQSWMRREQFLQGLSVGAPPDLFFREGQSWGINALSTHGLKQQGFQAYIEMLRSAFQYAGGVRIDHVLGLIRLWLVPEGGGAKDGAYLHYPTDDLIRLISLESHRHRAIVIGEDLGTLPPGCRSLFAESGILGMNVLWFQREDPVFIEPQAWSSTSIATTGTHDLATIAGWWNGADINILGLAQEDADKARAQRSEDRKHLLVALKKHLGDETAGVLEAKLTSFTKLHKNNI